MTAHLVRVVIAAEDTLLSTVKTILDAERSFAVVATCQDCESCVEAARNLRPDLALLDASLPSEGVLTVLSAVETGHIRAQVIFISRDAAVVGQLSAWSAPALIPNEAARQPLASFLRQVASEWRRPGAMNRSGNARERSIEALSSALTERERQVMQLVCVGRSNKEIERHLKLSARAVKAHIHRIYQKLAVGNRAALSAMAAQSRE